MQTFLCLFSIHTFSFFLFVSFFPPTLEPFIRSWMKDTSYRSQVDCALWGEAEPTVHMCRFLGRGSASLFGSQKRPEPSKIKDHCTEGRACFRHLLGFSFACPSALCGSLLFSHLHLECKYFLKNSKSCLSESWCKRFEKVAAKRFLPISKQTNKEGNNRLGNRYCV